ncbi:hypothetical protein P1X16_13685 [Hymenobacter sp. YC55]|nr:hypothetical protein [Hymenobacter sp. YC55]
MARNIIHYLLLSEAGTVAFVLRQLTYQEMGVQERNNKEKRARFAV